MGITIDVTGLTGADYRFAVSALAELCAVLHVVAEPAHHVHQRDRISAALDDLPGDLAHEIRTVEYLFRTSRPDMFLPPTPAASLAEELDAVDRLDDETWVATALLTSSCGFVPLLRGIGSPLTDPRARRVAVERAQARGPRSARFVADVLDAPAAARTRVRTMLDACADAFFTALWAGVAPTLRREVRHKRDLFAVTTGPPPVHLVTPALRLSAGHDQLIVDKVQDNGASAVPAGLTLLPSVFGAPHVSVVHAPNWAPVIQYPIAAGPDWPGEPDHRVLQRRLHALDNEIRYRLARSLSRADRTTLELAELWGLSSAEVSRHLAVLKAAGLAHSERDGHRVVYRLDRAALATLGTDLTAAFLR